MAALGLASAQAMATGFVSLPAAGFTVSGGTTASTLCNTTGNFGSAEDTSTNPTVRPTTLANNTCAVFPTSSTATPVAGYTLVDSSTSALKISDTTHTSGSTIQIGTVKDYVWRNAAKTSCIYGTRISLTNTDYWTNSHAGVDTFEVNGIARGGFAALDNANALSAGYYSTSSSGDDVAFRISRSFTSVQHRADPSDATGVTVAAGYIDLPLTMSAPTSAGIPGGTINGLTTAWNTSMGTPTASQQSAQVRTNWVEFASDVNYADADGSSRASSAEYYVQATCDSTGFYTDGLGTEHGLTLAGALRFRQSGQETADLVEITATGFVPSSSSNANY
ncbi:hypothetical protein ZMTM_19140 [Methyloradius palustris]|uniref:Uncharacterized protein n=2 Tax=Methyloradius palustris TaxID=2778876 RepID=A0A8D5G1H8_9PROT|nr:hypothetical protein ZMTM_19140 [Methyloradius palustris]